jgi:hypothetical protein
MECWFHLLLESCCFLSNLIRCKAGGWQSHLMIVLGERMASVDALQAEVDESKRLQAEPTAELDASLPAILDCVFKGES